MYDWNPSRYLDGSLALGIEVAEATPERVVATMTVDGRVHQPYGILHGGASVALAETVASVGGTLSAGAGKHVVGLEINANQNGTV